MHYQDSSTAGPGPPILLLSKELLGGPGGIIIMIIVEEPVQNDRNQEYQDSPTSIIEPL